MFHTKIPLSFGFILDIDSYAKTLLTCTEQLMVEGVAVITPLVAGITM